MKTLIVEDDAGTRALVKRIVQQSSKIVVEADNGLDALSIIEREDPDLVITDVRMPLLDGFELVEALRGSAAHAAMPIICLTAVDRHEEIARLVEAGITDYVLKPVKPAELTDRIKRAFHTHGNWRDERNRRLNRDSGSSTILIIDPDATFRSLARGQLEGDYEVIGASDAAEGLRLFHERAVKPQTVFVAENLPRLGEDRAADLLKQIAVAAGAPVPRVFVIVDRDNTTPPSSVSAISGTIRRSFAHAEFAERVREIIGAGRSTLERLRGQVSRDSNAWLVSIARHAFGVVAGTEIEPLPSEQLDAMARETTGSVRLQLTDAAIGVVVGLTSSDDHAAGLALAAASNSPGCDGPQLFGKLAAMIGWEVGVGLKARGFATDNPTPEAGGASKANDVDVAIGLRAADGQTLMLTVNVVERTEAGG